MKRREETIAKQKICIESQEEKIKVCEKKLQGAETKLSELRAKISRVNHRATYWRGRMDNLKQQTSAKKTELLGDINPLTVRTGYIRFAKVASQFVLCKIHFLDLALTKHTRACPMSCSIYLSDLEFHQTPVAMQ